LYKSNMDRTAPSPPAIPAYALYGEADGPGGAFPDVAHVETISDRAAGHGWRVGDHRHAALAQFLWIEAGGGTARLDGAAHDLAPGVGVFTPPLTIHGFAFAPGTEGWVLSVEAARVRADAPPGPVRIAPGAADAAAITALFRLTLGEHGGARPARAAALDRLSGLIALSFAREAAAARPTAAAEAPSAALVRRYLALLEDQFRDHPPVATSAAALGVSATHLSRACREVTGRPASALLHARLILEARRLLVYTPLGVAEVSWALGFTDPTYFSRFFAQKTGLAPSRFRAAFA
jgi:AraC family transcriptional activator of pobA